MSATSWSARSAATIIACAALLGLSACGGSTQTTTVTQGGVPPAAADDPAGATDVETLAPVFAGDPEAKEEPNGLGVLDELPRVERPNPTTPSPNIRGSSGLSVAQWISAVDNDVAAFWQTQFNRAGFRYRPLTQVITSASTIDSECGSFPAENVPAFYCPVDDTMYLSLPFLTTANRIGDTAVAFVVAHENGHHVQDLLEPVTEVPKATIDRELQADCLAGYWAANVYQRNLLERGDLEEAFRTVAALGDPAGTPRNDPNAHGSSRQRLNAFFAGYNEGNAGDCGI